MKKIFAVVIVTPMLTLFIGIGVLAFGVADKWDERNTDVLISNITVACGIGGLVVALLLSAFVGLIFYSRWQRDRHWNEPPGWRGAPGRGYPPYNPRQLPGWLDAPPLLPGSQEQKGQLYSVGPQSYEDLDSSLFSGNQPSDDEWRDLQ